ncbi:hypothetical protein QQP08_019997 [Theobroma cacao]|nr:hypothetical protein QQP08_019997 [Theobroma cacao]
MTTHFSSYLMQEIFLFIHPPATTDLGFETRHCTGGGGGGNGVTIGLMASKLGRSSDRGRDGSAPIPGTTDLCPPLTWMPLLAASPNCKELETDSIDDNLLNASYSAGSLLSGVSPDSHCSEFDSEQ